jgi:endonuclease/exonuclease/phosphatase family metal-dependent hydrolase
MKIGTWNVEYGQGEQKNALRRHLLDTADCDLWVLTETSDKLDLSATHQNVSSQLREGRKQFSERWVSIWSRLPIIRKLSVLDEQRTVAALIASPKGQLVLYGTVLPWHSDRNQADANSPVSGWSKHYQVLEEQEQEWRLLQQNFAEASLCVAGDLNVSLGGPHYYGTTHGRLLMKAALRNCGLFCATSFDRIPAGMLKYSPIDHVLLPADWKLFAMVSCAWEGTTGDKVRLSDHSGLAVSIAEG